MTETVTIKANELRIGYTIRVGGLTVTVREIVSNDDGYLRVFGDGYAIPLEFDPCSEVTCIKAEYKY